MATAASLIQALSGRAHRAFRPAPVVIGLAAPVAVVVYLLRHPTLDLTVQASIAHFYVVTFVSLLGFVISAAMLVGARRLREARAFFLTVGFLSVSGIFLIHALTTPGVLMGVNAVVGLAARLSLFAGSIAFALSTAHWSDRVNAWVAAHWRLLMALLFAAWLAFGAVAVLMPGRFAASMGHQVQEAVLDETPMEEAEEYGYARAGVMPGTVAAAPARTGIAVFSSSGLMALTTIGLLGFAAMRYLAEYRLSALPVQGTLVAGIVLLAEAQLAMWLSPVWALSWWGYHLLMLAGFLASLVGFGLTYARQRSLAGLVETLFLTDTIERIESSYSEAIFALVAAVEARDPYTQGHSARVSQLAVLIGEAMRQRGAQLRSLGRGGLIHDVGKLAVPDAVLSKSAALTPEEYELVKQHPVWGYEIIRRIASLHDELPIVLSHHEWYSGAGYPQGLAGEAIPLAARITAVADVYDALTSGRPYRAALTEAEAVAHLQRMAGTQFDPRVVDAFVRIHGQWSERLRASGQPLPPHQVRRRSDRRRHALGPRDPFPRDVEGRPVIH